MSFSKSRVVFVHCVCLMHLFRTSGVQAYLLFSIVMYTVMHTHTLSINILPYY